MGSPLQVSLLLSSPKNLEVTALAVYTVIPLWQIAFGYNPQLITHIAGLHDFELSLKSIYASRR